MTYRTIRTLVASLARHGRRLLPEEAEPPPAEGPRDGDEYYDATVLTAADNTACGSWFEPDCFGEV